MKKILPLTMLCLAFATAAFAEVTAETENFAGNLLKYPVISLPKQGVAKKINKKINESLKQLKKQHESLKGHANEISMSYRVLLETDTRLNLLLYSWTYNHGAAHGNYYTEGLSYDLTNGKRFTAEKYIGTPSASQLDIGIREGRFILTDTENKPVSLSDFWKVDYVTKECLLNEDDSLTLVYQIYDLAPYATGNTFVTIPKQYFPELSGKEPKQLSEKELQKQAEAEQESKEKAELEKLEQEQKTQKELAKQAEAALKDKEKAELEKLEQEQKTQKELAKQAEAARKAKEKTELEKLEQEQKTQKELAKQAEAIRKAKEKAELERLKQEHKAALSKLKAEQEAQLQAHKAKYK